MELVILIIVLALFEYLVFSFQTGMARARYRISAPATTGHPVFERYFRVQQNTLEQLVIFIPALVGFSVSAEAIDWPGNEIAAFLGVIWLTGRALYARAYVREPQTRATGFMLTLIPSVVLMLGTLAAILLAIV
jgi:glutathione S-transferase